MRESKALLIGFFRLRDGGDREALAGANFADP